jgi:hypothetical protein
MLKRPNNYKRLVWHVIDPDDINTFPHDSGYVLCSFSNFSCLMICRCEGDYHTGKRFYIGDMEESCISEGLYVNAWMPLPERITHEL